MGSHSSKKLLIIPHISIAAAASVVEEGTSDIKIHWS
jgi:hypothetical protein